jgi:hypothetical protein
MTRWPGAIPVVRGRPPAGALCARRSGVGGGDGAALDVAGDDCQGERRAVSVCLARLWTVGRICPDDLDGLAAQEVW